MPPCPRSPMGDIGMSTCQTLFDGSHIYNQICSVCSESTYVRYEVHLAKALTGQMEEKCQVIKLSAAKETCRGTESSLDNARHEKESLNIPSLADACRKVTMTYWTLKQEITSLVHKLKGERSKCSRQAEEMVKMLKTHRSLEEAVKISTSQAAVQNPPGLQKPCPDGPLLRDGPGS